MNTFLSYIAESLSVENVHKASPHINSYLHHKLGKKLFHFPEGEMYKNKNESGYGIRYFIPDGNISFRINWSTPNSIGETGIKSVDVWLDSPISHYAAFDSKVSLAKVLPLIADMLIGKIPKANFRLTPNDVPLNESTSLATLKYLIEAVDPDAAYDGIVNMIKDGELKKFGAGSVYDSYRSTGVKIFDALASSFPKLIKKDGTKYKWIGQNSDLIDLSKKKSNILDSIGARRAVVGRGSAESYPGDNLSNMGPMEAKIEKLAFKVQLADLEKLVEMTLAGAANALFVAGRGGVGKTHTVEKVLAHHGLHDNKEYFKNTGSASAAGIYSLLFKHKDSILLFDDSDDSLNDQESRNLFKAATDTKKTRKLVWNKMGKNVVDPGGDMSDEEILDAGMIPRFFYFTGKIIFISNLAMKKLDPDGAIATRAFLIDIDPTDTEVYDYMAEICNDVPLQDGLTLSKKDRLLVVEMLRNGNSKQTANLRKLSRGLNIKAAAPAGISDSELARMISSYA